MKFSQFAGTSLVPTLSRIVLALVFVTSGYNKLARDVEYTSLEARALGELGIDLAVATPAAAGGETAAARGPQIVLARLQETPKEEPAGGDADGDADEGEPTDEGGDADAGEPADEPAGENVDAGEPVATPPTDDGTVFTGKGVYKVTLMCHKNKWPMPKLMGYAAGLTELLGGAMILVGFLTRIWSLGLAITMGVAFYFVSITANGVLDVSPLDFAMHKLNFLGATSQLALFVLAFGLFTTGAGPLSLDRLLFGRGGRKKNKDAVEIEYDDAD